MEESQHEPKRDKTYIRTLGAILSGLVLALLGHVFGEGTGVVLDAILLVPILGRGRGLPLEFSRYMGVGLVLAACVATGGVWLGARIFRCQKDRRSILYGILVALILGIVFFVFRYALHIWPLVPLPWFVAVGAMIGYHLLPRIHQGR